MKSKNLNNKNKGGYPTKRELTKGNVLPIFINNKCIGTGLLVKKLYKNLPYINEDIEIINVPVEVNVLDEKRTVSHIKKKIQLNEYPVYNSERWKIKLIKSIDKQYKENEIYMINIAFLVGYFTDKSLPGSYDIDEEEYIKWCQDENKLIDKFIEIDGIELF